MTTESPSVDFSHRLSTSGDLDKSDYTESISLAAGRAEGMLHAIALQFESTEPSSTLCNELMYAALCAVINEIKDISSISEALDNWLRKQESG